MLKPLINEVILADEITVEGAPQRFYALVPIAEGDGKQAAILCMATFASHEGDDFYEFSFLIFAIDGDEAIQAWTPVAAEPYIPNEIRKLIFPTVCECYKAIIRKIGKMPIYRATYGQGEVPHRNEKLTSLLESEGYVTDETGTDEYGRTFWMMVPKV